MSYSKEELEIAIKADKKSLLNFADRMRELKEQTKETADEIRRLEAPSGASEATDGAGETEEDS